MIKKSFYNIIRNPFLIFSVISFLKVYSLRIAIFDDFNPFTALFFEMSFILILLSIGELFFPKSKLVFYIILDILLSSVIVGILTFHAYFGTIPTYHNLLQANQLGAVKDSVAVLLNPLFLLYYVDILLIMLTIIILRFKNRSITLMQNSKRKIGIVLVTACSIFFGLIFINSDTRLWDSITVSHNNGIFTYQALEVQGALLKPQDKEFDINNKKIADLIGINIVEESNKKGYKVAEGQNLVMIQLESFQDFVVNLAVNGEEITPNLNKLIKESTYYPNVYQQIGAGNTSDAEFIVNTSLYPIGNQATSEVYGNKKYPSLPRLLKARGYETLTLHADDINFWNRSELYPSLGFEKYYDESHIGRKDVVGMGTSDEVFYDKTLDVLSKLREKNQSFYAHVIALSSHTPFELPEDKIQLQLPKKYEETLTGNYLTSIHYADMALGQFIEGLKERGIWDNSLVVVYGDHSGVHGSLKKPVDNTLLKDLLGSDYNITERFNIPLVTHYGGQKKGEIITTTGGQIDVLPTIANLLGLPINDMIHFGSDLANIDNNLIGMRYYMVSGSYITNEEMLAIDSKRENNYIYDLQSRALEKTSTLDKDRQEKTNNVQLIMEMSDSYIEHLPENDF
ncbi:LTA synthase family protein [Mesobacillus jeotgali]|uniref:LTA synthase family protein n=1 Tax=Mesobacillus jeotgali TaxID=129985 RepID=A0ABY9VGE0_9BACI|nr:LTA synthase family protein [Mesobacillus jeotgali]WNF22683.1 LTA synthase family protein [Mesobacillus jeotgali]